VAACHGGAQCAGTPPQPVTPAASKAYRRWSSDPTYTTPFATAGDELRDRPAGPVHSGWHVFGVPPQFVLPAALNAERFPSCEPAYTTPFVTTGGPKATPPT